MKPILKSLFQKLPRGFSEWLQGCSWNLRARLIRMASPAMRTLANRFGGSGVFSGWPVGVANLDLDESAILHATGVQIGPVSAVARTCGKLQLEEFADHPHISKTIRIVELSGAIVDGGTSAVMDASGRIITELSQYSQRAPVERPWDHPVFFRLGSMQQESINGTCVLLGSPNGGVFFHWLLELFPRLPLMERRGILPADFRCLVSADTPFIRDSLLAAGVDMQRVIFMHDRTRYQVDRLLTTTDLFPQASAGHLAPLLKDVFLKDTADPRPAPAKSLIYISRRDTGLRMVEREESLIKTVEHLGGEAVTLDGMALREQALLFNQARCVIAPHGSSLTNLVFCQAGTRVLELFSPAYVRLLYPRIGTLLDLDYWYLIGSGPREKTGQPRLYASIDIDSDEFESTLHAMMS